MKLRLLFIGIIFLQIVTNTVKGQIAITKNDTIVLLKDSLVLKLNKQRGAISWQFSKNASQWIDIKSAKSDSLLISKIDSSGFYRAQIIDGNCNPTFSDSIIVLSDQICGSLKLSTQQNKSNIIIESFLDYSQPSPENKFSFKTNSLVLAFDTLIKEPLFFGFPGREEKANYQLNAKETALYFCMAAFPFIRRPNYANSIKIIKDALYKYPEVKTLEEKINEVVSQEGYLDEEKIGNELGIALDAIIKSFNINYEQNSFQTEVYQSKSSTYTNSTILKSSSLINIPSWNTKYQGWYRVQDDVSDHSGDIYNQQTGEFKMRRTFYNQTPSMVGLIMGKVNKETNVAQPVGKYIGFISPYYPPNLLSTNGNIDNITQWGQMTWNMITNGFLDALSQSDAYSERQDLYFTLKENEKDAFIFMNGYYDKRIIAANVIYVFCDILQDYLGDHSVVEDFILYQLNESNKDMDNYLFWWKQKNYDLIVDNLKSDFMDFVKSDGYRIILNSDKKLLNSINDLSKNLGKYLSPWASVYKYSEEAYKLATIAITGSSQNFGVMIPVSFDGLKNSKPSVNTRSISNLTESSVTLGGNIISSGGLPILSSGVCWNTSSNPEVNDHTPRTNDGIKSSSFTSQISGLSSGETYFARAYATNDLGTGYGNQVVFTTIKTTPAPVADFTISISNPKKGESIQFTDKSTLSPTSWLWDFGDGASSSIKNPTHTYSIAKSYTVTLTAKNSYGSNSKSTIVNVTEHGNAPVADFNASKTTITKGESIQFNDLSTNNPTSWFWNFGDGEYSDRKDPIKIYNKTGTFTVSLIATNSFGNNTTTKSIKVTETVSLPTVSTSGVVYLSQTSATSGGNVTSDGGATVTARGVCWNTTGNPTLENCINKTIDGNSLGVFTSTVAGLTVGTTYYFRAYATNSAGTNYGAQMPFSIKPEVTLPTVSTASVTDITQTSATCGGTITSDGGATITDKGVCWSTSPNPTISNNKASDSKSTSGFTSSMTGLTANTNYFIRAYATNSAGTAYGNEVVFYTKGSKCIWTKVEPCRNGSPYNFTVGLTIDGRLFSWGKNSGGQLGIGNQTDKNIPTQVGKNNDWKTFAIGASNVIAIKSDGTLWTWGSYETLGNNSQYTNAKEPIQIGLENDWKELGAGDFHVFAIKNNGTLWATGRNGSGQIGDGTKTNKATFIQIGTDTDWKQVSGGNVFTVAVKEDGSLWTWGEGGSGQCGNGRWSGTLIPTQIGSDKNWKMVSAGKDHVIALKKDGTLWAWGNNGNGQLGIGSTKEKNVPTAVGTNNDWNQISAGLNHNTAVKLDGSLWVWGRNFYGALGLGYDGYQLGYSNIPLKNGTSLDWKEVFNGAFNSAAINNDGSLYLWGNNSDGQIGNGTYTDYQLTPLTISCPYSY